MELTYQQLRKLAQISGLCIAESELESFRQELNLVFNFLNGLNSPDETESETEAVSVGKTCFTGIAELRKDDVISDLSDLLPVNRRVEKGFLRVPEVLDDDGSESR